MSTPPPYGQAPDAPRAGVPQQPPAPPMPPVQAPAQQQQPAYGSAHGQAQPSQQAQQGQHPQQAHQGQYPQQPPQQAYGAPTAAAPRAKKSGRAGTVVVTALVTAAVSVLATLFATGTFTAPAVFEQEALESGVSEVLSGDFELSDVTGVSCPAEVVAERGEQFECTFSSGGEDLSVPVEVLNDEGQYRVGGPLTDEDESAESTDEG